MCGILGVITRDNSEINIHSIRAIINSLFRLSESRGKEAAGLAIKSPKELTVFKAPLSSSEMIRSPEYKNMVKKQIVKNPITIIGHSRLATNGLQTLNENNQPVIKDGIVGVHNGIITNVKNISEKFAIEKKYDIDTEILLSLVGYFEKNGKSLIESTKSAFKEIEGTASIAFLFNNYPHLLLATNNGSLYFCQNKERGLFVFASEKYILKKIINKRTKKIFDNKEILQISPGHGLLVNLKNLEIKDFIFNERADKDFVKRSEDLKIIDLSLPNKESLPKPALGRNSIKNLLQYNPDLNLKRCKKCILPETFPSIEFDENGVCNLCRNYQKIKILREEDLKKELNKFKKPGKEPNCLVALSGGRDSSYALHYVKTVLKMNPIAFSYDWGVITDLGRRNQARLCGKLEIEQILISAELKKKREYIRKNILAWLKKPSLGMVPLFMAGDKQYFYYANKLKKRLDIDLVILGENLLEKTDFKTGFSGVKAGMEKGLSYALPISNKLKMATYYLKEFIKNPAYLNNSLFDTFWAYLCYYFVSRKYINLYQYVHWEENKINETLIKEYNWETAPDTSTTWRIGDGTAPFYNYIYYTLAGFTENDTFRSNQIREGMITREKALNLAREENRPRYEGLKWYAEQVGFDLGEALKIINSAPKLYKSL